MISGVLHVHFARSCTIQSIVSCIIGLFSEHAKQEPQPTHGYEHGAAAQHVHEHEHGQPDDKESLLSLDRLSQHMFSKFCLSFCRPMCF